jgi:hypothetical protein
VAGVVEPDDAEAGGLGDAGERAVEVARLDGPSVPGGEDVVRLLPLLPRSGAGSCLPHPVPAQGRDAEGGQRDRAATAALRGVVVEDVTATLHLPANVEDAVVEVEVRPAKAADLAPTEAHGDGEHRSAVGRRCPGSSPAPFWADGPTGPGCHRAATRCHRNACHPRTTQGPVHPSYPSIPRRAPPTGTHSRRSRPGQAAGVWPPHFGPPPSSTATPAMGWTSLPPLLQPLNGPDAFGHQGSSPCRNQHGRAVSGTRRMPV